MYENERDCPENFIQQLAFTSLNSFLLTTDGRVFSWGENNSCLGREAEDTKKGGDGGDDGASASGASSQGGGDDDHNKGKNLNEVTFMNKRGRSQIIQIATGVNHVLALDTQGNVYSWGTNLKG